jgi:hypothetical protein
MWKFGHGAEEEKEESRSAFLEATADHHVLRGNWSWLLDWGWVGF